VRKGKIGIGEAINCGISLARGNLIVFDLNNDDVVDQNWLTPLVEVLTSSPDIGVVCGKRFHYGSNQILDSIGGSINFFTGNTPPIGRNKVDSKEYNIQREVDYVPVIMTKKEILKKIGLSDSDYYIYYEDTDFCLRAKRAGYKIVYVPSAIFWHKGSSTVGQNSYRSHYYFGRNQIRFILKTFPLHFMFSALIYTLIFRIIIDLPIIARALSRSDLRFIKARKDAVLWNIRNIRSTLQERYRVLR
jgi:GT2 family glycosyltransferase